MEQKKESNGGRVEDKEVILIKLYEELTTSKTTESSFIHKEIKNLEQYIKFIYSPIQTRLFKLSHYQSLCSRGEQDPEFWKEVAVMFVNKKHNTEISWNKYPISMY